MIATHVSTYFFFCSVIFNNIVHVTYELPKNSTRYLFIALPHITQSSHLILYLWEHPTSLQAAPFRAPLSTYAKLSAALFRTPNQNNDQSQVSLFWPTAEQINRLNLYKKRPPSRPSFIQCSHQVESMSRKGNWTRPSRRKKLCPVARPRCLMDQALHWQWNTLPCGSQPCNGTFISHYNTPRNSDSSAAHHHYTAALLSG